MIMIMEDTIPVRQEKKSHFDTRTNWVPLFKNKNTKFRLQIDLDGT